MTHQVLLALVLSFGVAHFAVPSARACGDYGVIDPTQSLIRRATLDEARRRAPDDEVHISTVTRTIEGNRATAVVHFWRGVEHLSRYEVRLTRRGDHWRVVRFQRA